MILEGKRILITGGSGLVGRHLRSELKSRAAGDVVCPRSAEFDLRKADDVTALFRDVKPHIVFSLPRNQPSPYTLRLGRHGGPRANPQPRYRSTTHVKQA